MKLSDALLSAVVSSFRDEKPDAGADRRRNARTLLVGRAVIVVTAPGGEPRRVAVGIRDVSAGGVALIHSGKLAAGERFVLLLPPHPDIRGRGVVCTAAYCRPLVAGYFLIGAAFTAMVPSQSAPRPAADVTTPQPAPALPVQELIASFRQQAQDVLTPDELGTLLAIERRLSSAQRTAPAPANAPAQAPTAPAAPAPAPAAECKPPETSRRSSDLPRLLTREQCIDRAERAMEARTLSGVVAQVVTLAASPRGDLADLAALVTRDPLLSARILQAANSVGYASARRIVSTIPEAVRNIGCTGVRDIAATLAVFDAMPPTSADGFNPIRCWQHSFAAATLCQRLAPEDQGGIAYLVGLCHDLGEILFHTHFSNEYRQVLEAQAATGRRRDELERLILGTSHGELVQTILRCLGLPDSIRLPIQQYHAEAASGRLASPLARVLRMADLYANGAQLASSGDVPVAALTRAEVRGVTNAESTQPPDAQSLRSEVYAMTAMLARLPAREEAALMAQPFPRQPVSLWVARDPALSAFDPLIAALESLCDVKVFDRLPECSTLAQCDGLVVEARSATAAGFLGPEIAKAAGGVPTLWLCGQLEGGVPAASVTPRGWPVPLRSLAEFVQACAARARTNAAAAA